MAALGQPIKSYSCEINGKCAQNLLRNAPSALANSWAAAVGLVSIVQVCGLFFFLVVVVAYTFESVRGGGKRM